MASGKRLRCDGLVSLAALLAGAVLGEPAAVAQGAVGAGKFEVSFPSAVHGERITGRVFVFLAKQDGQEPRLAGDGLSDGALLFAVDVNGLAPGQPGIVDASAVGSPVRSLPEVPTGDYYAQALVNVYTQFHRADGHTIWAHMDQWEGQQFNRSPGNLYSEVQKVHLDSAAGYDVKLSLTKVLPAVEVPADTPWVKHVKMQSNMLTKFWGHPIFLGAVVLLPKGYEEHPEARYPTIYQHTHFHLSPPFDFSPEERQLSEGFREELRNNNKESGYEFYQSWNGGKFPRMIAVTLQHPTPYFDDSYAVNSVNNGPYGDAIVKELIPYLESHFRMIAKPYARVLTGGSTGGWESLASQVFYPDFFGGTWTMYPDPIDFRRYLAINVYDDGNAFFEPGHEYLKAPRYLMRSPDGQPQITVQQFSNLEDVLGSHGRSAQQLEIWEATYGPIGEDGYPKPLWDKQTGKIDHSVALYMRDHGYDLSYNLRTNWATLGPKLRGKIHVSVGDMDHFYLNLAVYKLEEAMKALQNPPCECDFQYGRPMKGHGWQPATHAQMIQWMAEQVMKNAPAGEKVADWNY